MVYVIFTLKTTTETDTFCQILNKARLLKLFGICYFLRFFLRIISTLRALFYLYKVIGEVIRLEGKPEVAIISKAEEISASLIVMGSRGLGTIRRTILGSVSEFILHHSHIPVMICRMGCDSV